MKTATIPSLRVAPSLRKAAEDVLHEGESLSGFVEASLRAQIELRKNQKAFIARGLTSRNRAKRNGVYHDAAEVMNELKANLTQAKTKDKAKK
jgi:hypothetical protein